MDTTSKSILSVGIDLPLLQTRSLLLKNRGYIVASVDSVSKARVMISSLRYGLLILCHTAPIHDRTELARLFKAANPSAKILVLVPHPDCDPQADACLDAQEGPNTFLRAVGALLKKPAQGEHHPHPQEAKAAQKKPQ